MYEVVVMKKWRSGRFGAIERSTKLSAEFEFGLEFVVGSCVVRGPPGGGNGEVSPPPEGRKKSCHRV